MISKIWVSGKKLFFTIILLMILMLPGKGWAELCTLSSQGYYNLGSSSPGMTVDQAIQSIRLDIDEVTQCISNINGLSEAALAGNAGLHDQLNHLLSDIDTKRYDSHFKARFITDEVNRLSKKSLDTADAFAASMRNNGDVRYSKWVKAKYQAKFDKATTKLIGVLDDELALLNKSGKYVSTLKLTDRLAIAEKYVGKFGKIMAALDLGMSTGDFAGSWIADGYPDQERFDIMAGKGAGIAVGYLNPVIGATILISDVSGMTDDHNQALVDVYNAYNAETKAVSDWLINMGASAYKGGFNAQDSLTTENFNYLHNQLAAKVDRLNKLDFLLVLTTVLDSPQLILNGKQQFIIKLQEDFETKLKYFKQINMVDIVSAAYLNGAVDRMAEEAKKQADEVNKMDEIVFKATQIFSNHLRSNLTDPYFLIQVPDNTKAAFDMSTKTFYADSGDKIRISLRNDATGITALSGMTVTAIVIMPDGTDVSVAGTAVEDYVEFTVNTTTTGKAMPAGRYRFWGLLGVDGSGGKHPVYCELQQLIGLGNYTSGTFTWSTYASGLNNYKQSIDASMVIQNGNAYINPSLVNIGYYWSVFETKTPVSFDGDNVMIEAYVKDAPEEGGLSCYDTQIFINDEIIDIAPQAHFSLMMPGCASYAAIGVFPVNETGYSASGINELAVDLSSWHKIAFKTKNNIMQIYYDNSLLKEVSYPGSLGLMKTIRLIFKGSGRVDWVKVYENEVLKYTEEFNSSIPATLSTATFLSENLPDGSYQVGAATKAWRFKSGATALTGLKAQRISADGGLGITQAEISIGDVAANTEFLVYLPINPIHDATSIKTSYWKFVDGSGQPVTITNSKTGQFWLKIKTNRAPEFNPLQLVSVAGKENQTTCLPILASDPDEDTLLYSAGVGAYTDAAGKPGMQYSGSFAPGLHAVKVTANDQHGGSADITFQAVITSDSHLKDFYNDVKYSNATTESLKDQYAAIHYLTLNGITIGTPLDPNDPSNLARIFKPASIANQAEALAMIMKAASLRGVLDLNAEARWLPNLVREDVENGVFYNFSWALPYVVKAEALGMIPSADTFDPNKAVTREWLAMLVTRMMTLNTPMDAVNPDNYVFADAADFISPDAYDAARAASFFGYMKGQLGSAVVFNPLDEMIRADVAVVTAKILRTPRVDGITTSGLSAQMVFGKQLPSLAQGQSFTVTGSQNLSARRMLGDGAGNIQEDPIFPAADYTTASVIRPGHGVVASRLFKDLAATPITVPTNPDISFSEMRSLIVLLESVDDDGDNPVRSIYHMQYGVVFPDADGDGVRDEQDLWPTNSVYSTDANGNGIPDNADSLWGLTSRSGSSQIKINGQVMTLQNAVLSGQYSQMMNDPTPPTIVSTIPTAGSQNISTTPSLSVTFTRELDQSTISPATVSLVNVSTSAVVAGAIAYDLGRLEFTPSAPLALASDYRLTLSTAIKDLAGHVLANAYSLNFKTELAMNVPPTGTVAINGGALYTSSPLVTLAISATDLDGVSEMCFSATATCTAWQSYAANSSYQFSGIGLSTVYIWFKDAKGLASVVPAASASITVDVVPPSLTLSMLADNAVTRENLVNVTGVAKDIGSGINSVTVNGKPVEFNAVNGVFSYPLPLTSPSTVVTVACTDMAGNTATSARTVRRDAAGPSLTIDAPTDYSTTNLALMAVRGTVEPGATVAISLNGTAPVAAQVTGTTYTAQVTLVGTVTLNTVQVTATGLSGKSSSAKRSVRYISARWNMDVTDPPQDTLTMANTYLLKGKVANAVNAPLAITITRGTDTYTPTVTNGTFEQLVTLPSNGLNAFSVLGTDSQGNKSSVTRVFNKGDFELPVITEFSMPATYNALQVPLTFTASDNVGITAWCASFVATTPDTCNWVASAPTSYTFRTQGTKNLYGYVKDANGNISSATATTTITAAEQPMTVSLNGSGKGTVTSSPAGISCISGSTAGCSVAVATGTTVSLFQTPQSDSTFSGWSGDCTGTGACSAAMTAAKAVSATFTLVPKAMIGAARYESLAAAYIGAGTVGATILALDMLMPDNGLILGLGKAVTLKGGYNADYMGRSGMPTVLKGVLKIRSGKLVPERLVLR